MRGQPPGAAVFLTLDEAGRETAWSGERRKSEESLEKVMTDQKRKAPEPEVVYVDKTRVACDGGGALGHPRVWYSLDDGEAECGYCDRKFVYDPEKAKASSAS